MTVRRPGRRTNIALLGLLGLALLTGVLGYGWGTAAPARLVIVLHGVAGLGLLTLVPWKRVIVGRGLRRARARPGRWSGILLGVLVVVCVVAGVVGAMAGSPTVAGITVRQIHDTVRAILDCTGGWYAAQIWRGTRLDCLLPRLDAAHSLDVVSVTGYRRRLPAHEAGRLLLATHAGGLPLSAGHGGPARLVAPGRRGFWWVKWVDRIEVVEQPWWWQPPFPTQ